MDNYIETRGLQIHLDNNVYTPREDSFLIADHLNLKISEGGFCEVGSGSGFVCIYLAQFSNAMIIATDIDYNAALLTHQNASINNCDQILVLCTDLLLPFRKEALPDLIIFNPPYLPEDPNIDPYTPTYELNQIVGGKHGYEVASRLLETLNLSSNKVFLIISSLSTNPVEFSRLHSAWTVRVIGTKNLGFETIWLIKMEGSS